MLEAHFQKGKAASEFLALAHIRWAERVEWEQPHFPDSPAPEEGSGEQVDSWWNPHQMGSPLIVKGAEFEGNPDQRLRIPGSGSKVAGSKLRIPEPRW